MNRYESEAIPSFCAPTAKVGYERLHARIPLVARLLARVAVVVFAVPVALLMTESRAQTLSATKVPLTRIASVASGRFHTCAVTTAGGVKCWGSNDGGQLGDGTFQDNNEPRDVVGLGAGSGVTAITAGDYHTCALTNAGGVKCWGGNSFGQLGYYNDIFSVDYSSSPLDVWGLGAGSGTTAITAGSIHTCALIFATGAVAGAVKCWGANNVGQLGDSSRVNRVIPTDVNGLNAGVTSISAGRGRTCVALPAGARLLCWGQGIGLPSDFGVSDSPVNAISVGALHGCAVVAGSLSCWGENTNGQVGDGTNVYRASPIQVLGPVPAVSSVSAGSAHSCSVSAVGRAQCWGYNDRGRLGDGTTNNRNTPADVVGLSSGAAGISVGESHTCAVTTQGGVKCWGANHWGQLGIGTTDNNLHLTPADVLVDAVPRVSPNDFNGDGKSDLILQNVDGRIQGLLMNGVTSTSTSLLYPAAAGWRLTHIGDFNLDGKTDAVFANLDGRIAITLMNGLTQLQSYEFRLDGWTVSHVGDFNGDGKSDILWRNTDGSVAMWLMDGLSVPGSGYIRAPDLGWRVTHIGDLNNDGMADLIWRNSLTGEVAAFLMNGTAIAASRQIIAPGTHLLVTHLGDLNGDGKSDLVLVDSLDQRIVVYLMNGLTIIDGATLIDGNAGWRVTHVGDINGDGKADLLLKQAQGRTRALMMNGLSVLGKADFAPGNNWTVSQLADFNGDGRMDAVFQSDTGALQVWLLNGAAVIGSAMLQVPGTGWTPVPVQ
jgi:alpha-tubulin suppressor-like RCC1 family protein